MSLVGGSIQYQDMELPQDVCAAGRVQRFGVSSEPSLTTAQEPFATGLSPNGRLTSAAATPAFYGQPLVAWTPALGANIYELQWSKTKYPFTPQVDPRTQSKGYMTFSTSAVLPLGAGTWYYRVRGIDFNLPTGVQQMSWSDPEQVVVTKPKLKIVSAKPNEVQDRRRGLEEEVGQEVALSSAAWRGRRPRVRPRARRRRRRRWRCRASAQPTCASRRSPT